jgi:ATP-dependent Lhr-like helicase
MVKARLMPLSGFDPLISEWFGSRFAGPTKPQVLGWPEIRAGRDVLISAPTGSGKTLAAFLICLDGLVRAARTDALPDRTEVVYVSPLKALSNDIRKNLEAPLAEIADLATARGARLGPIRAAVRTGDTTVWERQQMLQQPPHILVTTPESLFLLLTADKSRAILRTARTVIVDEIHAVADDKRGSHLALSLARLEALIKSNGGASPQRIGLSATVKPIEEVACFLSDRAHIINVGHRRDMELAVEIPRDELGAVASNEMWTEIYDRLAELIRSHRTTLVFVNTRRLSERVTHHLAERLGKNTVLAHHGSLSKQLRLSAEQRLKNGELRAVVATASLELGIDIGSVDLVCQLGSPRSIAVGLQRTGRSGHWVGARPKGRFFATTRDELVECAALVRSIRAGELDRLEIPEAPLDILAQQIVAAAACEDWREDDLFELVRSSYPYRSVERSDFNAVIEMLSEGIATERGRNGAFLHRDRVNGRLRGRRGARLAAITSGGAIPDSANYLVVAEPEGISVGTVDEDFAVESLAGDIFLLGTTSWRIRRVEPGRLRVEDARGAPPSIPFWRGEAPGRTAELSQEVSRVREEITSRTPPDACDFLIRECGLERRGAEQAGDYVRAGQAALGALPTGRTIIAERFFDEGGGMQLVLHAPFGARINRAWGLALRKRFCRSFNLELQAAATDNGIVISLSEQHSFPLEIIFGFLKTQTVEHVLTQALLDAPMFTARWRWNASRALAVLRFAGGRKVPPPIQRMRSDDLLAAVFPDQAACAENLVGEIRIPDHPLVKETIRNCLCEAMDLNGLGALLEGVEKGTVRTLALDTPEPSPFSHEILNANPYAYLDDAPLEERRARAVQLRRTLRTDVVDGVGALDTGIIAEVTADSWPVVRDPDELHDALLTLAAVRPTPEWKEFFDSLLASRRATTLRVGEHSFWVAAERIDLARIVQPEGVLTPPIEAVRSSSSLPEDREACAAAILRGWLESTGPVKASELAAGLAMPRTLVDAGLAQLESEGQVLRGKFTPAATEGEIEWCNRRILARIHRLTLGKLRREIEPVTAADFMRFLARWQHVVPGSQLHRVDGTLHVVRQLQGYEIPAAAWESRILPRRIAQYNPEFLDRLCLSGEVMWGRLSRHPAFEVSEARGRRVRPTRIAPVTIFLREEAETLLAGPPAAQARPSLSHPAREVLAELERRGASFFAELQKATRRLSSEVEDALWELVAAGLVTADGFENLRSLVDPKRRRGEGRGRHARPRHAAGRWALLRTSGGPQLSAEAFALQLLRRWGVVFRDLLARETLVPAWRDLLVALRRMEARGEVRGGRFVAGFVGEQFALPEALELLRAVRREGRTGEELEISTADPLNLIGIILPGSRISALSGGTIRFRDGVPVTPEDHSLTLATQRAY